MIKEVQKNKTLLLDGPASVLLVAGAAEILGAPLNTKKRAIIRNGKRVPVYVKDQATFNITYAEGLDVEEVDGDTIPSLWKRAAEKVLSLEKPTVAMIMGSADSGKTSLCTFIVNLALKERLRVAVIDADLGQSDIGPPTTVGLAYIQEPTWDLYNIEADDNCFVGRTSPNGAMERVAKCIAAFKDQVLKREQDVLVINTDGWIEGLNATEYKTTLAERVEPDVVVALQRSQELEPILANLEKPALMKVPPPTTIKARDRESRKTLRELSYRKFLRNGKIQTFPLRLIRLGEPSVPSNLDQTHELSERLEKALGVRTLFCRENERTAVVVLKRNQRITLERLRKAEETLQKEVQVSYEGSEKGLIVGLHDDQDKFMSLGIICGVDHKRQVVKIHTHATRNVSSIQVGCVKLDTTFTEIATTPDTELEKARLEKQHTSP